jgi:hypothetical protein
MLAFPARAMALSSSADYRARMAGTAEDTSAPGERASRTVGLEAPALILLVVLSGIWAWWALEDGAYFGVVLLPGTVALCLIAIVFAGSAPWPTGLLSRARPAAVAIGALIALACWAGLSAIWSPAPDVAIRDAQRILVYALAFGLGIWLCALLGGRVHLSLTPVVVAAAAAGIAAIVALLTSDAPRDLLDAEGTLYYPIGYRNAEAAFFGITFFCALGLAAEGRCAVCLRAAALGTAALCVDGALFAQSRGSVVAMPIALVVYLLVAPRRGRALLWLLLAVLPALTIVPAMTSMYEAAQNGAGDAIDEMRTAGATAAVNGAGAVIIGALAASLESRIPGFGRDPKRSNRVIAVGMALVAVAGVAAFAVAVGDPFDWIGKRANEFRHRGSPDLTQGSSRFVINAGSDRYDVWRVAVDDAGRDPLLGDGGGGFQYSYLRHRTHDYQQVHDAHSIELENLAELGIPGLALLLTALVAAFWGIVRVRRRSAAAAGLAATALASGAYWLAHSSLDWFWPYPALTTPALFVLGAASAPALGIAAQVPIRRRLVLVAALAALALSAVPPFFSDRYIDQAYAEWRTDLGAAYDDLDRAHELNRLSNTPILAEGAIATAAGDRRRALNAFEEAAAKRPEEWAAHYLLAKLQQRSDPAAARREIRIALDLNPLERRSRALARQLGVSEPAG